MTRLGLLARLGSLYAWCFGIQAAGFWAATAGLVLLWGGKKFIKDWTWRR